MAGNPTISIAMCTYNGSPFLRKQLDSVIGQHVSTWEMIIVDDCSSDQTWHILESYAARDSRIRIYRNERNLGYNLNFEKALRLCSSEYIAICDQDDIWHPDKLLMQMQNIGQNQLIYHDSEFIDQDDRPMNIKVSDRFRFYRGADPTAFLYLNCVSGHSILMKREVLARALPFPPNFHYDQWLAFVATDLGSIEYLDQPLVSYRQHSNNNTDMLALKNVPRRQHHTVQQLYRESEWLLCCAEKASEKSRDLIVRLHRLSVKRNVSFASLAYGLVIWQNKEPLLSLLRKSDTSKFFYTIRKIWGSKAKKLV